jgi:aldehyde dehydrogenase (NAD+)
MISLNIQQMIQKQREYFFSGVTRDIAFRKKQLILLEKIIRKNEQQIIEALFEDLRKPDFESYAAEIGILYPEIRTAVKNIYSWAKPRRVPTPVLHFLSSSYVYPEPYGITLIIGPWNYPFQLTIAPLIAAIAAGNCAILKPSELSPATSGVIAHLISEYFDPAYIAVFEGGVEETTLLLQEKFDYIFFTGGTAVGKVIMNTAARHLTPVTLELGGKSPTIVHRDAHLEYAAKRIAWGKYFNAGQTCLAPDYLLVHREIKERFINIFIKTIISFYGNNPSTSPDYARIINSRHFARICALMKSGTIIHGGRTDPGTRYIEPTILDNVHLEDPIMKEEIFGPLFPVISYENIEEALNIINAMPRPLALYLFTKDRKIEKLVLQNTSFGGGCINDTVSHVGSANLPFGGIGDSGMGLYHGKAGFDTFSHQRSVLKRSNLIDMKLRYPPYGKRVNLLKKLFRIIG